MTAPAAATPATGAATDPMDDISDVLEPTTATIPEHMMLDGTPVEAVETVKEPEPVGEDVKDEAKEPEVALPEGYTRDSLGRIHGPNGHILKKAEAEKLLADATASQQPTNTKPEPFRYRHNGQNHEVEGFEVDPATGVVTVKPEHVGLLRDALNTRHIVAADRDINAQLRQENATLKQQVEQGGKTMSAAEARAEAFNTSMARIFEIQDDNQFAVEMFRLREQYPTLLSKAEAAFWKQKAEAVQKPQPQPKAEPREPSSSLPERAIAVQQTQEYVERLKLDHAFRDLTPENWQQLGSRFERTPYAFLRPATAEEVTQYGVRAGEIVFDTDAFHADVQEYVSTLRAGRATADQRAKLAAENARRTQPSVTAPPTPGGSRAPAKATGKITSKEELDDWWESSEL